MVCGMTRLLFIAFALACLAGCGKENTGGPAPLRVGMELSTPPFEMADSAGRPDGVSVRIAEDPLTCVARGTAIYLENLEEWKATMDTDLDEG